MFEVIKIDSLKLRIPRHKVTYIDQTFAKEYQKLFIDSGEIEDHINLDKNKVDITNGITTRIAVFHSLQGQIAEEQIVIQCNSKQLQQQYFEGITKRTVEQLYRYIINLNIIDVSYSDFLNAYVSDIDICYDVNVTPASMIEANQEIYRNIKMDSFRYVSKPFRQKTNVGIQFNTREKATPAKPYIKIYHKTLEFESKSAVFAMEYLKDINWQDVGRLEYTIKNNRHREHLNLNYQNFKDLLNIDNSILEQVAFSGVLNYIEKKQILREYKDLSPTDRLILHFINKALKNGSDKQTIYCALHEFENPQEKSRMKKKLKQLVEQVDDQRRIVTNADTLNFLRDLRLDF